MELVLSFAAMEALVAVGFAANILNFVDFICHALKIGNQIRRNGMSDSNADLEKSITLLEHQMNKIRMQCGQTTSDTDVDEVCKSFGAVSLILIDCLVSREACGRMYYNRSRNQRLHREV